jgi:hypothetical protein
MEKLARLPVAGIIIGWARCSSGKPSLFQNLKVADNIGSVESCQHQKLGESPVQIFA